MEILRREYKDLKNVEGWMLIYGRRKVGKSFLIRKYVNHDLYYVITRDLQAYCHGYINQKFIVPDPNDERTIQEKLKKLIEIYGENFIQNYVDTDILYSRIPIPTNWGK
ncbi:hypothetical protein WIW90_03750 [Sulfolobaceae archaeon RB850M]